MYIKNIEEYVDHVPYNTEILKITNKLRRKCKKEYRRRMKEQRMQRINNISDNKNRNRKTVHKMNDIYDITNNISPRKLLMSI